MDALLDVARRHGIAVIEDACEAIGATYKDQRVGSFGDISVFAFYPNKQLTTGEGGAILTRDQRLADRMRALRNQGRYPSDDWLQHSELGYNYRLSEMACALGLVQLSRLPSILTMRAEVAGIYDSLLLGIDDIVRPPLTILNSGISWFVYVIRLAPHCPLGLRDELLRRLREQGVGCGRYFAPIHLQPAYAVGPEAFGTDLPVTESIAIRTLALPFFNRLPQSDIRRVVTALVDSLELVR
jgi:perosamine synthetase